MLSKCLTKNKIPKIWRQSKIIAILKPGQTLFEQHLIKEQVGFRHGKSCTSQLLSLTQHIEDGYQRSMNTGAAFVDLSAAYDKVNNRIIMQNLYNITQDSELCRVLQNMLSNRRFYVEPINERSRWRIQKTACPRGVSSHQSC